MAAGRARWVAHIWSLDGWGGHANLMIFAHGEIFMLPFEIAGVISGAVIVIGIAYFIARDAFRFGRGLIPVSWAIVMLIAVTGAWIRHWTVLWFTSCASLSRSLCAWPATGTEEELA